MPHVIENAFDLNADDGRLSGCIAALEDCLRSLRETPYHAVIGRSYLHHVDAAARYITEFHRQASRTISVAAIYFEMNGFAINRTAGTSTDLRTKM